jgi:hypothetical protein
LASLVTFRTEKTGRRGRDTTERREGAHPGYWELLKPEQRILRG